MTPDISKCNGLGCQNKETCYRYLAKADSYRQSYAAFYVDIDDKGNCEHYWPCEEV